MYLGHWTSGEDVKTMLQWPIPANLKEIRGFFGLTGYYRKFVKKYGEIATPLTQLLKKDAFAWNSMATEEFELLKKAMVTLPVLALPDFSLPFTIETYASKTRFGAVLIQRQRPIAYSSHTLSSQASKSVYERELMAIVLVVQRWRPYLLGQKFLVRTDQKPLRSLLEQRKVQPKYQRLLSKPLRYNFEIHYRLGSENKVAIPYQDSRKLHNWPQ